MDSKLPDTKGRILSAAYRLFYRQGFSRVSIDAIADNADVTKRTIYYHFRSKDDVITSVMKVQHLYLMEQYRSWLGPSTETADDIAANLFSKLKTWAEEPDWLGSGFSRISAELADMRTHPARQAASKHKEEVEVWLTEKIAATGVTDADQLSRQFMLLIEGSMSLSLIHGDTAYIDAAMKAARKLTTEF